jgi:hypothetical protein
MVSAHVKAPSRMRRFGAIAGTVAAMAVAAIAVAACGSDSSRKAGTDAAAPKPTAAAPGTAARVTDKDFDPRNFSDPLRIDNAWSPLVPGTRFVYEGRANRGQGRLPHRVVFTVTDLTKTINGVRSVVLWDRDFNGGRLREGELAFHAQDDDGNIWNMGEYPEEYEGGRVTGAPDTWISGVAGARAGVLMRGLPRPGTPSYLQGWAPEIEFSDRATVHRTGARDCVPVGCFRDVLVTDETNPLEPADGHQRKYYAHGVGNIRAAPVGGREKEVLVLTDVIRLTPAQMAAVRREALKLDRRGYATSRGVYGRTPPAEPRSQP